MDDREMDYPAELRGTSLPFSRLAGHQQSNQHHRAASATTTRPNLTEFLTKSMSTLYFPIRRHPELVPAIPRSMADTTSPRSGAMTSSMMMSSSMMSRSMTTSMMSYTDHGAHDRSALLPGGVRKSASSENKPVPPPKPRRPVNMDRINQLAQPPARRLATYGTTGRDGTTTALRRPASSMSLMSAATEPSQPPLAPVRRRDPTKSGRNRPRPVSMYPRLSSAPTDHLTVPQPTTATEKGTSSTQPVSNGHASEAAAASAERRRRDSHQRQQQQQAAAAVVASQRKQKEEQARQDKLRLEQEEKDRKAREEAEALKQLEARREIERQKAAERQRELEKQQELERQEAERQRLEQLRLEEERIRQEEEEMRRFEQEQNRLAEEHRRMEEAKLQAAIEEHKRREEEARLAHEEELRQRIEREEQEKRARDEAEKKRLELEERLRKDEEERLARKKRVEAIMSRTKKTPGKSDSPASNSSTNGAETPELTKNIENKLNSLNDSTDRLIIS